MTAEYTPNETETYITALELLVAHMAREKGYDAPAIRTLIGNVRHGHAPHLEPRLAPLEQIVEDESVTPRLKTGTRTKGGF